MSGEVAWILVMISTKLAKYHGFTVAIHVVVEGACVGELLSAGGANVICCGAFPVNVTLMVTKGLGIPVVFRTNVTFQGAFSCVEQLMSCAFPVAIEILFAEFTGVPFFVRVVICVVLEKGDVAGDGGRANVTYPRFWGMFGSGFEDLFLKLMAVDRSKMIVEEGSGREFYFTVAFSAWIVGVGVN